MKSWLVSNISKAASLSLTQTKLHMYGLRLQMVLLTTVALALTGCSAFSETVQKTLEIRSDRSAQASGIYTVRLDRWTDDVPEGTLLQIDADNEYQVYLTQGDTKKLLGKLEQQLPDTPLTSMFIDTGTDRFIVGWIDESVQGHLRTVRVRRDVADSEPLPVDDAAKSWGVDGGSRIFFIPIFSEEIQKWEQISGVRVSTEESIRALMDNGDFNPAFRQDYDPPIDVVPLLQRVTWP